MCVEDFDAWGGAIFAYDAYIEDLTEHPQSTLKVLPVMQFASLEAKKTMVFARSTG